MLDQRYGQYQIKGVIGEGGMATVYRADQESIGRDVALKILPEAYAKDPGFLRRFRREVHLVAQIEHPSIVPVYDYGEAENQPFIVMRLLEGGTLEDRMLVELLSSTMILHVLKQIAGALDHAHSLGVIHRDIKPSNILLDESGNAFLTDFGIARIIGETTRLTKDGVMGTPTYMSPEQCQALDLTPATDIYSLGVIAFELLTGLPPYDAEKPLTIMYMHVRDAVPDIYKYANDLPEGLGEIFETMMHKDPEMRYSTATEFVNQLERFLRGWHRAPKRITPDDTRVQRPVNTPISESEPVKGGFDTDSPEAQRRGKILTVVGISLVLIMTTLGVISIVSSQGDLAEETPAPPTSQEIEAADIPREEETIESDPSVEDPVISIYIPGKIVYISGFGDEAEMITSGADGTSTRKITSNSWMDGEPDWSPDGSTLVFESTVSGNRDIYSLNISDGSLIQLTDTPVSESNPDWSPDGETIIFEASDGSDIELYTITSDGSGVTQITENDYDDRAPQYSPDGEWITYMNNPDGAWQISILSTEELEEAPQHFDCPAFGCRFPAWSPDSRYLAFNTINESEQAADIWAVDIITGELTPLIQGGSNGRPCWVGSGEYVFFNREVDNEPAIYWMDTRSGEIGRFSGGGAAYFAPDWAAD